MSSAISRLSERLALLVSSHAKNSATLDSLSLERVEVDGKEKELREMVANAEEKRAWFGSFKEWVEVVASFLDEKVSSDICYSMVITKKTLQYPMLERLEEEYISLLTERAEMVAMRRNQDDEDDLSIFLGPIPIQSSSLENADEIEEIGGATSKLDSLQERRNRRVARQQLRSTCLTGEEEGFSTDSSLAPSDANAYAAALQSLTRKKKEILSDVGAEEFRDPGKGRWRAWRENYSDSYIGAWGGLGVVNVWEFWMRLESVGWNCIDVRTLLTSPS